MTDLKPGWKRVKFGEVVRLNKETCKAPEAAGIERVIGLEHLEPGDLRVRSWANVADGTTFTKRVRPGQVLFGKRRAYQRKVAVADFDAVCSGDIYVLESVDPERLLPELLPFICQTESFFEYAVGTSAGSLSPRTNWKSLAQFEFALPSLEEQMRIVELLISLRSVSSEMSKLGSITSSLLEVITLAVIGDACAGVPCRPLLEFCSRLPQSGIYKAPEYLGKGVPIVQMGELFGNDFIDDKDCSNRIQLDPGELSKFSLNEGDLLFGRRSIVLEGAGRCVLVGEVRNSFVFESSILRVSMDSGRILPRFLFEWFRSPCGVRAIRSIVTFTTVAGIKGSDLQKVLIPEIPIEKQLQVCEIISKFRSNLALTIGRAKAMSSLARVAIGEALDAI
jgi:type I restriction enzyme S subunit